MNREIILHKYRKNEIATEVKRIICQTQGKNVVCICTCICL